MAAVEEFVFFSETIKITVSKAQQRESQEIIAWESVSQSGIQHCGILLIYVDQLRQSVWV
jgi:hypothetical protein